MAKAAVASWTTCIRLLQQLVDDPRTATASAKQAVDKWNESCEDPLPNAAWKKLVQEIQVTRQLAALCIQAHQRQAALPTKHMIASVLGVWLCKAQEASNASPASRLVAIVEQQLQESGLLQHLPAILANAADILTEAAAAVSSSTGAELAANQAWDAVGLVQRLLNVYFRTCCVLSAKADDPSFSLVAALPAALSAVRLILTTIQTCSRLQQLASREDRPAGAVLLAGDTKFQDEFTTTLALAHLIVLDIAQGVCKHSYAGTLPSLAGVSELLLCPELVPCLAIMLLVTVLAVGTCTQAAAGSDSRAGSAAAPADSSSSSSSSSRRQASAIRGSSQQSAAAAAAGSSAARHQAGSSSSSTSSSGRLANGVSLDSLTPLSRRLFPLLGVEQGVLLRAAKGVTADLWGAGCGASSLDHFIHAYSVFMENKVGQLYTPCGASNAQLLLQAETDMLLGLAVHQLTASIPASYPASHKICDIACKLRCSAVSRLSAKTSLHQVPLSAPYTGPQLALQVMPSPLGPAHSRQWQQQPQLYTVTPAAQLLTEQLPLLSSYCLARVQQQQERRQQLLEVLQQQLQQVGAIEQAAELLPAEALSTAQASLHCTALAVGYCGCPEGAKLSIAHIGILLSMAVVPDPTLTAAAVEAAASAASAASGRQGGVSHVTYSCALHAPSAVVQTAGEVIRLCEVLVRDAATGHEALAAAAAAAGATTAAVQQQLTVSGAPTRVAAAEDDLTYIAGITALLLSHAASVDFDHNPCPLALAALSAGPGSNLQRQLYSLLCSMVKLGYAPVRAQHSTAVEITNARYALVKAAAFTTAALVAGSKEYRHQPCPKDAGDQDAAAVFCLPGVLIGGRCCMFWAKQLQEGASLAGCAQPDADSAAEFLLTTLQQWLQASSTQEQLVAAGYAPQALPQQLQQAVAALQAAVSSPGSSQPDTAQVQEAAQQLQAAGSALCSFAVPSLCNNPSCTNLSGLTEQGLVSGRSCVCGGCRVARYCGRACQRAVWKQHKPVCAALAAAASAD